ncbi:MAG TPA: thiamine biosynthesis protein ThiS [Acidimicrobiales bacterium]|nr:thiamine biosynthesis protein ThiS [Acidimicrobiales bacterium]
MKVVLRNPRRELEVEGPVSVTSLLGRLELHRDAVLVIRDGVLVPGDAQLPDEGTVEIRPVISGGAGGQVR